MDKSLKEKIKFLDPKLRDKIEGMFNHMYDSISLLYDAATRDEKTGLYNTRFFETIFSMETEKAKRGQQNLSLIILDIDFFKKINDKYGHVLADDLLKQLAKVMVKNARTADTVTRFGGEEFLILLPETNLSQAKRFAKRLQNAIHKDRLLKKYKVTASGGITQYRKQRDSKKSMKSRADKALYQAKNSGRDRFIVLK